ncbi:MAG: DNA adenine methylase [Acidobacteria bacterium]|nr:DNA adenine methylase [Acidobacteriota bacterium]MCW5968156.1 DNA adenine methylase [Blastocatellales bacterium]
MNYIGSKHTLLPFIEQTYRQICDGSENVVCDLFAGTGAVGRHFKRLGLRVIANDLQYYSYVLNKAYIEINEPPAFSGLQKEYAREIAQYRTLIADPIIEVLAFASNLTRATGFITQNYSPIGSRFYYTEENAERADALRQALEIWKSQGIISSEEYFYLLCSLIEAIDQVANTASVYGAFLKKFKASALKPLTLKPLTLYNHVTNCQVFNLDANELIGQIESDILYLDPPYNHRQYGANYHVLETIASYDSPEIYGITGLRDYMRSRYCQPKAVVEAFEHLIRTARTKHILLSYNDEGLLSLEDVHRILSLRGEPRIFMQPYSRFKADSERAYKRDETIEYLHYVRVVR